MSTQYPTQPYQQQAQQPAGIATASVVLGAIGFVVGICSVIGLVLGLVARGKARRGEISPARITAGIVTSAVSLALGIIGWAILIGLMGAASSSLEEASDALATPSVTVEAPAPAETVEAPAAEEPAAVEATEVAPVESATPAPAAVEESGESVAQKNAARSAENYIELTAFSRTGLINQLEFEGFSTEDATYGVDKLAIDYNEQAAKAAANYLDLTSFSRQSLIDQLVFEGYSQSEAEYGVSTTGL